MKAISTIAVTAGAIMLLSGCDVTDPIYNSSHPNQGTVTLTTNWSGIGDGLTAPDSYTVVAADHTATLTGTVNRLDYLFPPAALRINVYNTAAHISINGTTATVATAASSIDGAGPFIQHTPGWLFASSSEMMIEKDREHFHTAVMQQHVRELTLMIAPTGGTADKIERIEGYLTGAAASLNFADGTHATPSNVPLQFTRIADGDNAGNYLATVRLLGTTGQQQKINATIHFTDGSPASMPLDSDLTTQLATFNADKRTPLTLTGTVVETPTEAGFKATIDDWRPVEKDPIVAE